MGQWIQGREQSGPSWQLKDFSEKHKKKRAAGSPGIDTAGVVAEPGQQAASRYTIERYRSSAPPQVLLCVGLGSF